MKKLFVALAFFLPYVVSADIQNLQDLINYAISIINSLVPLLFGVALVGFIIGVIKYIFEANPAKLKEARSYIVFSIIGMAVMLSIWSLAFFVKNSFFPSAGNPFGSGVQTSGDKPGTGSGAGTIMYCAGDYTTGHICNHGAGIGICNQSGQCIVD